MKWTQSVSSTLHEVEIVPYDGGTSPVTKSATLLSQEFSSLTAGTVYNITVRSRNKGGWSLKSEVHLQITGEYEMFLCCKVQWCTLVSENCFLRQYLLKAILLILHRRVCENFEAPTKMTTAKMHFPPTLFIKAFITF